MNLYLRFLILVLRIIVFRRSYTRKPMDTSILSFIVCLHDCDINLHLTNARYFSFMDLGRTLHMAESGLLRLTLKHRWKLIASAQEIAYLRELPPFHRFQLHTTLLGWDNKYCYFEQRFERDGRLYSLGHSRVAIVGSGKVFDPGRVMGMLDPDCQASELPAQIKAWKQMLSVKRQVLSRD
ncbi:MAG: hypothetical protein B0D91_12820 [Oceanospirillales bacterium LUC14_002_19_P2]|nr:MAG: hypothetical protein B0D91_12820 [Oceanospirillales bacterium LUC14_002_19_P2]